PCLEQNVPGDVYTLLTIEPNPTVLGGAAPAAIPTHLRLLVDLWESMDVLASRDPNPHGARQRRAGGDSDALDPALGCLRIVLFVGTPRYECPKGPRRLRRGEI